MSYLNKFNPNNAMVLSLPDSRVIAVNKNHHGAVLIKTWRDSEEGEEGEVVTSKQCYTKEAFEAIVLMHKNFG